MIGIVITTRPLGGVDSARKWGSHSPQRRRAPVEDERYRGNLGQQIKAHWEKYRPRTWREFDQAAALDEAVHLAEALTVAAYDQAIDAGLAPDQARELVREEWAFLPDEEDMRRLPPERDPRNHVRSQPPPAGRKAPRGRNLKGRN
jgi:hypothetical protein